MLASDARAGPADGRAPSAATAVYLYGVVRAGSLDVISSDAVFDGRVALVEEKELVAITSRLPSDDVRVRRRDLRRHLDVLEEAFSRTTVLPCRFGTALPSTEDVRAFLTDRAGELATGLERLEGCVQLNLTVSYDEEELMREIVARDPEIASLREATRESGDAADAGHLRLGQLVAAAVDADRERDATAIAEELTSLEIDVAEGNAGAGAAFKGALLVRARELSRVESQLEALAQREHPRLRFELLGPLPPTAFAAAAVEA